MKSVFLGYAHGAKGALPIIFRDELFIIDGSYIGGSILILSEFVGTPYLLADYPTPDILEVRPTAQS